MKLPHIVIINNIFGVISINRSYLFYLVIFTLLVGIGTIFVFYTILNVNEIFKSCDDFNTPVMKAYFIPFHFVIMLISSVILCTLAYVSWRKYRALKAKEKSRKSND